MEPGPPGLRQAELRGDLIEAPLLVVVADDQRFFLLGERVDGATHGLAELLPGERFLGAGGGLHGDDGAIVEGLLVDEPHGESGGEAGQVLGEVRVGLRGGGRRRGDGLVEVQGGLQPPELLPDAPGQGRFAAQHVEHRAPDAVPREVTEGDPAGRVEALGGGEEPFPAGGLQVLEVLVDQPELPGHLAGDDGDELEVPLDQRADGPLFLALHGRMLSRGRGRPSSRLAGKGVLFPGAPWYPETSWPRAAWSSRQATNGSPT